MAVNDKLIEIFFLPKMIDSGKTSTEIVERQAKEEVDTAERLVKEAADRAERAAERQADRDAKENLAKIEAPKQKDQAEAIQKLAELEATRYNADVAAKSALEQKNLEAEQEKKIN